jgi:GntR family transcriptional regulator
MFEIDLKSRKSISDQIVDHIKELIVSGVMVTGEKMLSVRELAGQITVNPNTVQKAYRILEKEGYIYTARGRGTFVSDIKDMEASPADIKKAKTILADSLDKMYYLGISKEETRKAVDEIIAGREDWQ